jgi:flagellin-like protein
MKKGVLSFNRKGLSPVVATVLLIAIGLLLASIIFLWARGLLTEKNQKFDEPIENACGDVSFTAEVIFTDGSFELKVINRGDVPLKGVEIQRVEDGSIRTIEEFNLESDRYPTLRSGETSKVKTFSSDKINEGSNLRAIPVIIGQKGVERLAHHCDDKYAESLTVKAA